MKEIILEIILGLVGVWFFIVFPIFVLTMLFDCMNDLDEISMNTRESKSNYYPAD
jgi:hypothetical protein